MSIIYIILGFILGFVCYFLFRDNIIVVYHGPSSKKMKNKLYKDDKNKIYRLKTRIVICPCNTSMKNK